MNRVYTASVTGSAFMKDNSFFRVLSGPIGSGKSVVCTIEILRRCKEQFVGPDGFRRSRWVIVRNTASQLNDTTLRTWFDWIPPGVAGRWKASEKIFYLEFGDVRAEILFRPLDSPDDVQRVLSLELTGAWLNEAREINRDIVEALQGRLGRYPSKAAGGSNWIGMIADTNPPEVDSYWYKVLEGLPIDERDPDTVMPCAAFKQPSGLSAEAENIENLVPGYYERLAQGKSKNWVDTYIHGLYSPSLKGVPVYNNSFRYDRHVSKKHIKSDPFLPVIIGMDFGRTPAAVFKQVTMDGRINTLCEAVAFGTGLDNFIKRVLKPLIKNRFYDNPLIFIGDPAGVRMNDTDDRNCFKLLKKEFAADGASVKPARTNDPIVRIGATEKTLLDYIDGEPAAQYDPSCKWLIEALRSRYRYANVRNPDLDHADKPEKNNWSHVAEADQYANLFIISGKYDMSDYVRVNDGKVHFPFEQQVSNSPTAPALYVGY